MVRKIKAWLETYVLWWISCVLLYQLYQINVNLSLLDIRQGLIAFYLYFILLEGPSFYFAGLCTALLMVGWCEIAEYRSLSYTYFSKEKIDRNRLSPLSLFEWVRFLFQLYHRRNFIFYALPFYSVECRQWKSELIKFQAP